MSTTTLVIPCASSDGTVAGVQCVGTATSITVQATIDDSNTIDPATANSLFVTVVSVPLVLWLIGRGAREVFRIFERI